MMAKNSKDVSKIEAQLRLEEPIRPVIPGRLTSDSEERVLGHIGNKFRGCVKTQRGVKARRAFFNLSSGRAER